MNKTRELLSSKRFMRKYNADKHYMWHKPQEELRRARTERRLPHPCMVFERVYSARHGTDTRKRHIYMGRLQDHQKKMGVHFSAFGFWRPKDRLPVYLPDGRVTLRAYVA